MGGWQLAAVRREGVPPLSLSFSMAGAASGRHIVSVTDTPFDPAAVLAWHAENGIDTTDAAAPQDFAAWTGAARLDLPRQAAAAPRAATAGAPPPVSAADAPMPQAQAVAQATALAAEAGDLAALKSAIDGFEGCPLHKGARQAVVFDGVPGAPLLVMGEAPGRDEDREGLPFVGRSGQLLDRMLGAIGISRREGDGLEDALISNAIYWRPPGNRTPTKAEVAVCLPFMRRFIELARPKVLLLAGNVPTQSLFPDAPGITKSRGRWRELTLGDGTTVPALPVYHPAFLLRQPIQKRLAWRDLLAAKDRL